MRLGDEDVKKRIKTADTNLKKKPAWKVFSDRLSETLKVVFSGDQVLSKYKKLEREHRQGKSARRQTGNDGREDDTELCDMLNTAFARRAGVRGANLADADNVVESSDENMTFAVPENLRAQHNPNLEAFLSQALPALTLTVGRRVEGRHVRDWRHNQRLDVAADAVADAPAEAPVNAAAATVEVDSAASGAERPSTGGETAAVGAEDPDSDDDDVILLHPPPQAARDDSDSETEWAPTTAFATPAVTPAPRFAVREITNSYVRNGQRVYVVDWEQTEEPEGNLPPAMVSAFNRRRLEEIRRVFIVDEAHHGREHPRRAHSRRTRRPLRRLRRAADN
ncbi:uncharacterized protein IUM83_13344 [Phytophthora cinnamomi]|uniref:uncharacterized protein n=1 Tax=Phytophthora cinnamomi TaxID=4785 RepID=UPI00355A52BA|nr:hypothetical protein IUM83_13344 [Phytophthora cinnamomi]